jgi:cytochrome c oxidase subunit III
MGIATRDVGLKPGLGGVGGVPGGGPPPDSGDPRDWPPGFTRDDATVPQKYRIGIWVGLASILMLFVALTSAYIVRQRPPENSDVPYDWTWIEMPSILWFSTAVLLISSGTLERARRLLKRNDYRQFNIWITVTSILGIVFLVGQILAWQQLKEQGTYSSASPHGWFFYLLTGLHAVHLVGGMIALLYVNIAALRLRIGMKRRVAVDVTATYWHFMDGLWVYLFLLLFFWK